MYTYESFAVDGVFTLLRPMLITFVIMGFLLFIGVIFQKRVYSFIHASTVIILSLLSIIVSAQVVFYEGVIVDELGLGGDAMTTYIFLVIIGFSIVNPLIYFSRHKR
ncbi:hypothetical protein ACQKL0_11285 [Peribacillus sp. NPDC097264]|uniref:hypothetical protein n=1 Tax=Peribacillus sp. NPDC097264 TaxID=3390616 RepID=UPI003D03A118